MPVWTRRRGYKSVRVNLNVLLVWSRALGSVSEGSTQFVKLGTETTILIGEVRSGHDEVIRHLANAVAAPSFYKPTAIRIQMYER